VLKNLFVFLVALVLFSFGIDAHADDTKQVEADQSAALPVAPSSLIQQNHSATLKSGDPQHVQADVRIVNPTQKDGYDKASFWISFMVALVGCSGAIIGVLTLLLLRKQTTAIKRQSDQMAAQLVEMRNSTEVILKQTTISERALIAQFRPKVIVRNLRLDPSFFVDYDRRSDGEWRILIQLANIGGTKATIFSGMGYFQEYRGRTPHQDLSPWWILKGPIVIEPGQRETIEYSLDAEKVRMFMNGLEASTKLRGKQPDREPVFHGSFVYRDESGIERETGFGRSWNVLEERFVPFDDPSFEYQD
jgi:hypothetical protein